MGVVAKDESFRKAGLYCLLLAFFGAIASVVTGLSEEAAARTIRESVGAIDLHKQAGILTLVLIMALIIGKVVLQKRPASRRVGYILYLLVCMFAVINVLRAGYSGLELVHVFGVGVRPVMKNLPPIINHPSAVK